MYANTRYAVQDVLGGGCRKNRTVRRGCAVGKSCDCVRRRSVVGVGVVVVVFFFFFLAEDGIRGLVVTGVQSCALPVYMASTTTPPTTVGQYSRTAGQQDSSTVLQYYSNRAVQLFCSARTLRGTKVQLCCSARTC